MEAPSTYLVFGISKGLGKAIVEQLPNPQDHVFGISRSEPSFLKEQANVQWISADLPQPTSAIYSLKEQIKDQKIDYFIYNVGIWEQHAFSEEYTFENSTTEEIITMINTNTTSCILSVHAFLENLKKSENAKVVFIGSTWGLDNHNGKELVFSATKYALRGITQSLRENLRPHRIGVSVINLGYLNTTDPELEDKDLIPLHDVIEALRFITSTSNASCVKEITMPAMSDTNV